MPVLTCIFFISWLFNRLDPAQEPRSLVLVPVTSAVASILVVVFCLLACIMDGHFFPRTVVLARNWMGVIWEPQPRWLYSEIAKVRFGTMHLGQEEFQIMTVTSRDSREIVVGIPKRLDLPRVIDFLKSKGVEV